MSNTNIGNNSGIIGDGNTIIFNLHVPLTKEQLEFEFLKLGVDDFQDITNEVDITLREKNITIFSYTKNYWLQLKMQLVNNDFVEPWIPFVPADMPTREKKPFYRVTPIYQSVVLPFSYFFISMDGGRYLIPLPEVEYNKVNGEIDKDNPIKCCKITEAKYKLGKSLDGDAYGFDDMLKQCKISILP